MRHTAIILIAAILSPLTALSGGGTHPFDVEMIIDYETGLIIFEEVGPETPEVIGITTISEDNLEPANAMLAMIQKMTAKKLPSDLRSNLAHGLLKVRKNVDKKNA